MVEVLEGQSCTFECVLSHENTSDVATWTVGGKTVGGSGRFRASRQGRKYTLAIQDAAPSDAGEVMFSILDLTSKASLIVRGGHGAGMGTCLHGAGGTVGPQAGMGCSWGLSPWAAPRLEIQRHCWGLGLSHLKELPLSRLWAEAGLLVFGVWSDSYGSP